VYPDDAAVDLSRLLIYPWTGQYEDALRASDRIERAVGEDAYLDAVRADLEWGAGHLERARLRAREAQVAEPGLGRPYRTLWRIALAERDFAEATRLTAILHREFGLRLARLAADTAAADLLASKEYRAWLRGRRAARQQDGETRSPGR
jgi:hypothetical protein